MGGSFWGVTLLEVDVVNTRDSALLLGGLSKKRIELFGKVAENDRLNEGLLRVKLFLLSKGPREASNAENQRTNKVSIHVSQSLIITINCIKVVQCQ